MAYVPAGLPVVDRVEVVLLLGIDPRTVRDFMSAAAHAPRVVLEGAETERIAGLWRSLPPGEPARCHLPTYGLRFLRAGTLVVEASACWDATTRSATTRPATWPSRSTPPRPRRDSCWRP